MSQLDKIIFKDKSFSDILKEIYDNSKKKETQISALISELKPLINDFGDATLIVPLIKEYLEMGIKNDEQLIKMLAIAQRALVNQEESGNLGISEEEKEQLLKQINDIEKNSSTK
jgi:methanogenic corrinoid protein MtbC1